MSNNIQEILSNVEKVLNDINQYHLRMEGGKEIRHVLEFDIDVSNKAMHILVHIEDEPPRKIDYFWIGDKAYGKPHQLESWDQVSVPGKPVSYLHSFFKILKSGEIKIIQKETLDGEQCWVLLVKQDLSYLRQHFEDFIRTLFPQLVKSSKYKKIVKTMHQAMKEMKVEYKFWISQQTYIIRKVIFESRTLESTQRIIHYITNINDLEITRISFPEEALESEGLVVPFGAPLMKLKGWGQYSSNWGWSESNHCRMTEEAIKLIKTNDNDGKYQEIYHGYEEPYYNKKGSANGDSEPDDDDHPCVIGAWAEDAWENPRPKNPLEPSSIAVQTYRANNHFGGKNIGLKYEWYFKYVPGFPPPPKSGYYPSARDWGLDGANTGDKMNFQGAIEVYNYYTPEGIKEAYRRIGHVVHLLQDIAQPDHAGLQDHAGSALTEPQAYSKFEVRKVVAIEAAIIGAVSCGLWCMGPWFLFCYPGCIAGEVTLAMIAVEASIDDDQVGFEYLVREEWDFDKRLKEQVMDKLAIESIESTQTQPNPYFNYFSNMHNFSLDEAKKANKPIPIGLGKIPFYPYSKVPGLDPNIKPDEHEDFLSLADKLLVKGTNMSAGFLQHFFEVVNYPPYIQEVVVVQDDIQIEVDKLTGEIFPVDPDKLPNLSNVKYQAAWECRYDHLSNKDRKLQWRELHIIKNELLDSTPWIYVIARVTSNMNSLDLTLKTISGAIIYKTRMEKVASTDTKDFYAYHQFPSCNFPPTSYYIAVINVSSLKSGQNPVYCENLILSFNGEDLEPHFSYPNLLRNHTGKMLDSNPVTIAVADPIFPHNWKNDLPSHRGYEPGPDENHRIKLLLPDLYEPNDDLTNAATLQVSVGNTEIENLTLHDSTDKDFFKFKVPINPQCKGATSTILLHPYTIIPSVLQICAKLEWPLDELIVTFFLENGQTHEFNFSLYQTCPESPLVAGSASFIGVEDYFPDGTVQFSVEAKTDQSGNKKKGGYSITIKYGECEIEYP